MIKEYTFYVQMTWVQNKQFQFQTLSVLENPYSLLKIACGGHVKQKRKSLWNSVPSVINTADLQDSFMKTLEFFCAERQFWPSMNFKTFPPFLLVQYKSVQYSISLKKAIDIKKTGTIFLNFAR